VEYAFGNRAFTEKTGVDARDILQFIRQRKAGHESKPAADNCIAAEKVRCTIEQMHRTAASTRTTGLLAEHFGHDDVHWHAAHQRMAVFAVGGNDVVLRRQRMQCADSNRLFAHIKMQEATDLSGTV